MPGIRVALPATSSFTCFRVKPVLIASSAWVQFFSSRRSRMVSPGGETQSAANCDTASVMIVTCKENPDARDACPVDRTTGLNDLGHGLVRRLEHQPVPAVQTHSELTLTVALERVRMTGHQTGDRCDGQNVGQPRSQLPGRRRTQASHGELLLLAQVPEFGSEEQDLHRGGVTVMFT